MKLTIFLILSAALLMSIAGVIPERSFRGFTRDEKWMGVYVVLLVSWPLMCTTLIGPLLWNDPKAAGLIFPTAWYIPSGAIAIVYFARTMLVPESRLDLPSVLQFSLLGISAVVLASGALTLPNFLRVTAAGVLLLPTLVKPSSIRMDAIGWGCRISLVVIVASVWLSTLVNSNVTVASCRLDKCSVAHQLLTSPFSGNGNLLGISLALLVPFVIYRQNLYRAALMILSVAVTAEVAGSRTAIAGIAVGTALAIAVWARPTQRRLILLTVLGAALVVSVVPAVIPFNAEQFVFRGRLWHEAHELIALNPILGAGPFAWARFGKSSIDLANYSPHNGWLDTVLSIGVSGLVIMVIAVALKLYFSRSHEADVLLWYFAVVLTLSTLESVYVPYYFGIVPFSCVLPFLFGTGRRVTDEVEDTVSEMGVLSPTPAKWSDA